MDALTVLQMLQNLYELEPDGGSDIELDVADEESSSDSQCLLRVSASDA
jgi:hypothetical protein